MVYTSHVAGTGDRLAIDSHFQTNLRSTPNPLNVIESLLARSGHEMTA